MAQAFWYCYCTISKMLCMVDISVLKVVVGASREPVGSSFIYSVRDVFSNIATDNKEHPLYTRMEWL